MKTEEVRTLFLRALDEISEPYSVHIIDEVFQLVEQDDMHLKEYERLCEKLGREVVNNWGGRWVAIQLGKTGEQQVPSKLSKLIASYSILDTDAVAPTTESDARKQMSDYYMAHKSRLPNGVQKHRDEIIALILGGMQPEEAFETVLGKT